ncbi:restriction endonuclease subunit S [Vibrio vulnificus]|uniref:restriction endonuclease subunit S n=1 Tax=Vibrio vulnificus TaxID=672 RepID=UPI003EDA8D1D
MEQVLYSLPDGWEWHKLKDLTTKIGSGATPKGGEKAYKSSGISLIRSLNVHDCFFKEEKLAFIDDEQANGLKNVVVESGDVLLNITGASIARCCIVPNEFLPARVNQHVAIIRPTEYVDSKFLNYLIVNPKFKAQLLWQGAGGATRQALTKAMVEELNIPLPSLPEQKRIVEKLDALLSRIDTAIEHLQENLDTSKSLLASALFEKFHQEVNPTPIKDIFNVYNGRAYKKPELLDSGKYKVIRIQNLKGGKNYYYSGLELDENKYCESGDLLFSWSGTPGTSFGAFIWNDEKAIYHYHIWKMEPKVEIAPRYAYWVLKDVTEEAIANARGVAGMLHITKGTMESFIVSLPSYEAQQKIAKELDELALKSEQLQAEISSKIDSLKHLKASILDSAFKGEL